jgi:hypothetical protein
MKSKANAIAFAARNAVPTSTMKIGSIRAVKCVPSGIEQPISWNAQN